MKFVRNVLVGEIILFVVAILFCMTVWELNRETLGEVLFWLGGIVLFIASLFLWGSSAGRFEQDYYIARTTSASSKEERLKWDLADHERSHWDSMTLIVAGSIAVALSFMIR